MVKSSSGGIAAALSEYFIKNNGIVVGCGFEENLLLKHSIATELGQLEKFKGSKYLQSNTVGIYCEVKKKLDEGTDVLFIGTPCQVSGLLNYLPKNYSNLYTIDFVCHGVMSHKVFEKYLSYLGKERPINVTFRNKENGYQNTNARNIWKIEYPQRTVYNDIDKGAFLWFASALSTRQSCYNCHFISNQRPGDLTLADYTGKDLNDIESQYGVSTVFVNSEKGKDLLNKIKEDIILQNKDADRMVQSYERLTINKRVPKVRKKFFEELESEPYEKMVEKYTLNEILPSKFIRRIDGLKQRIRTLRRFRKASKNP